MILLLSSFRHLQMKLAYLFWKPVQKMPQMLNKLSWPWLPPLRIGTHILFLLTSFSCSTYQENNAKIVSGDNQKVIAVLEVCTVEWFLLVVCYFRVFSSLFNMASYCRMASQPTASNAKPTTVQIRGQPVAQQNGCCSS